MMESGRGSRKCQVYWFDILPMPTVDLVATLEGIQNNDKYFKRINLNNHREVTPEYVVDLISALQGTHTVRVWPLRSLFLFWGGSGIAWGHGRKLVAVANW